MIKGQPRFAPNVTSTTPNAVALTDCVDGTEWLNYGPDGNPQNDAPGGKHHTTATVGLVNGRWLVTQLAVGATGTCV